MKKLCFRSLSIVIFTASFAFANPVINSVAVKGNWKNASMWCLDRASVNDDAVVISADKLVVVNAGWPGNASCAICIKWDLYCNHA